MLKLYLAVRWRDVFIALGIALVIGAGVVVYRSTYANTDFEIVDALGGNIFPSAILSVATTDVELIQPVDTPYAGNPKSLVAVKVRSRGKNSRIRLEVEPTPFFARSVSEFVLPDSRRDYIVYPDIAWDYEALRANRQANQCQQHCQSEENLCSHFIKRNTHSTILNTIAARMMTVPASRPH